VTRWKASLNSGVVPTEELSNQELISDNNCIHYNLEKPNEKIFTAVSESKLEALQKQYGYTTQIKLTVCDNHTPKVPKYHLDPPYSEEDAEKRRQEERRDNITIVTNNAMPAQKKTLNNLH